MRRIEAALTSVPSVSSESAAAAEAVGQLTAGMAHEFNNMLQIISVNAELLASDGGRAVAESQELKEIRAATERGASMISQLLSFSRRAILNLESVEASIAIRRSLSRIAGTMPNDIHLEDSAMKARESVLLDTGALDQILASLCRNAGDAMPDGGTIRVQCAPTCLVAGPEATQYALRPGSYVCITVSDTGQGMDAATLHRIFEPFFTTKPLGQGTGLGLSMVLGMMRDHDGAIRVLSEVGKGTVVHLYFPAETPLSAELRFPQPADQPQRLPPASARGGQ